MSVVADQEQVDADDQPVKASLVTFLRPDGSVVKAQISSHTTVMQLAVDNEVDEVLAECGGSMTCGTCHVFVAEGDTGFFQPPSEDEEDMLVFGEEIRRPTSRLACQLPLAPDGPSITVEVPSEQP